MTAAWWQVLGAVVGEPLPVAGIARAMGMTRQGVQRIADLLVERGLAEYRPNPAHRRAKLLWPTDAGREAITKIAPSTGSSPTGWWGSWGPRARATAWRRSNGSPRPSTG
ncbi:MarR family winged helix-turn-helix transcriptional regulator [Nonomuraea antimicrobica]